jgi:hypothetical protein
MTSQPKAVTFPELRSGLISVFSCLYVGMVSCVLGCIRSNRVFHGISYDSYFEFIVTNYCADVDSTDMIHK